MHYWKKAQAGYLLPMFFGNAVDQQCESGSLRLNKLEKNFLTESEQRDLDVALSSDVRTGWLMKLD